VIPFFLKIFAPPLGGVINTIDPLVGGAIISGLVSAGGAVANAIQGSNLNEENREFAREQTARGEGFAREQTRVNIAQSERQMAFQERLANTAHQREMADLEAAGLNPILAASHGGAPVTSGSAGSAVSATQQSSQGVNPRIGDALSSAANSAMAAATFKKQLEQADASIAVDKATVATKVTEADKNNATAKGQKLTNKIMQTQMPSIAAEADKTKGQADWDVSMQGFDNWLRRAGNVGSTLIDIVNPINSIRRGMDYKYQRPQQPGVPYPPGSPGRHNYMDRNKR